ncbi:MAG: putative phosphoesterase [Candidatus Saccharibacteria bacterium]|nr:putative phosphoesterase [Candidatus Saccharibacteria bacterium]
MFDKAKELIDSAQKILVIQAENPDGDSLGSALALEEILGDLGKAISLYCDVETPKYLRYINGWDRVSQDFDTSVDLVIIVDTSSDTLIGKALQIPGVRHFLETHPVLVIDHHHETESTLSFDHTLVVEEAGSSTEVIYKIAEKHGWKINKQAAEDLLAGLLSDTLGLSTQNVGESAYLVASKLAALGASPASIEERRREFMKKSAEILKYKGVLIERIEYYLDGKLAVIRIPWEEIQQYSDQYNPSVLVLDEMRLVEGVEIGVAIKTYPDGKLTGKLRSNLPISTTIAGFFGGGGHPYASGFRVYESIDKIIPELIDATDKALKDQENAQTA